MFAAHWRNPRFNTLPKNMAGSNSTRRNSSAIPASRTACTGCPRRARLAAPLGPLVAFATEEGITIKPDNPQPFYGYYFRRLDSQGPDAKGGAKPYSSMER